MSDSIQSSQRTSPNASSRSQTLSRGLRALEIVTTSNTPLNTAEVAERLNLHRSVTYRILKTLEDHGFIESDDDARFRPGIYLATLAGDVHSALRKAASPVLHRLARETGSTAYLVVASAGECITLESVEPPSSASGGVLAQHPGSRHRLDVGAPSIAIQSALTPEQWKEYEPELPYRKDALQAGARGYALSRDEVITGLASCASPVKLGHGLPAAVGIVYLGASQESPERYERVRDAAHALSASLRGTHKENS